MPWYWIVFLCVLSLVAGFILGVWRYKWVEREKEALKTSIVQKL